MSKTANTLLIAALTPDNKMFSEKMFQEILNDLNINEQLDFDIKGHSYSCRLMRTEFDDCFNVQLPVGTIYFMTFITFGYGTKISWTTFENQKANLEVFAKELTEKFNCSYEIFISANYY